MSSIFVLLCMFSASFILRPNDKAVLGYETKSSKFFAMPNATEVSVCAPVKKVVGKDGQTIAWIFEGFLTSTEQRNMYRDLIDASTLSGEERLLVDSRRPFPFAYWNNAYMHGHNLKRRPDALFAWTQAFWDTQMEPLLVGGNVRHPTFNSVYAQLYFANATMPLHKDAYVDWGVSVSVGAGCRFLIEDKELLVRSGDIMVADFSKHLHSVSEVFDDAPEWFLHERVFGRVRASFQIRDVVSYTPKRFEQKEFYGLLNYGLE